MAMSVAVSGKQISKPLLNGRTSSRGSKRSPYRTKSYGSEVDETLFGTPTRYSDQKDTPRVMPEDVTWDPPWVTSPSKTGVPLLWTPFDPRETELAESARKSAKSATPRTPTSARNKYRVRKMVPSYVDETLFGAPLKEPEFEAPWESNENNQHQVTWSPPLVPNTGAPAQGVTKEKKTFGVGRGMSAHTTLPYTPVIKARPGSVLTTPGSKLKPRSPVGVKEDATLSKVQQKLDFGPGDKEDDAQPDDPNAIVQRALRLAGISSKANGAARYRSNSLGSIPSRATSPGGYFWKRPSSIASSAGKPASGVPRTPSQTPRGEKSPAPNLDDLFSTVGTRVPLSARSTPRPNSARSGKSFNSMPGLDLSQPPRAYGFKRSTRPSSTRSASQSCMQSSRPNSDLSNRPSWRP